MLFVAIMRPANQIQLFFEDITDDEEKLRVWHAGKYAFGRIEGFAECICTPWKLANMR
jgi:hypothetical protein